MVREVFDGPGSHQHGVRVERDVGHGTVGSVGARANRLLARVCVWTPPSLYTQRGLEENKLCPRAQLPLMENKSNLKNQNGVPGTLHLETVFPILLCSFISSKDFSDSN